MPQQKPVGGYILPILIGGFAFLIVLLTASAYTSIGAMRYIESEHARNVREQRANMRLIGQIQQEEDSLSAIFYSLADGRSAPNRAALLGRLDALERRIAQTTASGAASPNGSLWQQIGASAATFIAEGRRTLLGEDAPSALFFQSHQALIDSIGELTRINFEAATAIDRSEREKDAASIRFSLILLGIAVAVALTGAILTVYAVHQMFRRLQWQTAELDDLSSRTMSDQEEIARRMSRELHDEFGQTLNAIEANLVAMSHARQFNPARIEDCLGLIKDAMENVRQVSQLFRPSILDDFGLDAGLRWMGETFTERTGLQLEYSSSFSGRLSDETETQLFRIAQEALTNVSKHANASSVKLTLRTIGEHIELIVSDNGAGLGTARKPGGLGLVGMRARARSARGTLQVRSGKDSGVTIEVRVPYDRPTRNATQDTNSVSR